MPRIRVNPPLLRSESDKLAHSGDNVGRIGYDVWNSASGAPSYDGQFGSRVRGIGGEAISRAQAFVSRYSGLAEGLKSTANAFEIADAVGTQRLTAMWFDIGRRQALRLLGEFHWWAGSLRPQVEHYLRFAALAALNSARSAALVAISLSATGWISLWRGQTFRGLQTPAQFRDMWDAFQNYSKGRGWKTFTGKPLQHNSRILKTAPRDYALLSDLAYEGADKPPKRDDQERWNRYKAELKDQGWEPGDSVDKVFPARDLGGYYGVVYINNKTKEIVIAHRGTKLTDVGDLDSDANLTVGRIPPQYLVAKDFTDKMRQELDPRNEYKWTHTGHSLGGVLADLVAYHDHEKAITFENPGALRVIQQNPGEFPESERSNLVSYQSNPNLVHGMGKPAGFSVQIIPVHEVSPLIPATFGVAGEFYSTKVHHDMQNIIQSLDKTTGLPIEAFPPDDISPL